MLVLSRKIGESIVIGGDIVLTVIGQQGDRIKLGFEAPKHVTIHRQEVFVKVQAEENARDGPPRDVPHPNMRLAAIAEMASLALPAYVI